MTSAIKEIKAKATVKIARSPINIFIIPVEFRIYPETNKKAEMDRSKIYLKNIFIKISQILIEMPSLSGKYILCCLFYIGRPENLI
jgi:hypothetical protein